MISTYTYISEQYKLIIKTCSVDQNKQFKRFTDRHFFKLKQLRDKIRLVFRSEEIAMHKVYYRMLIVHTYSTNNLLKHGHTFSCHFNVNTLSLS